MAIVMCKRMHIPEEKNPRKRWQRILHIAMPGIIGFGIMLVLLNRVGYETMFSTWEGWLVMVGDIAILSAGVIRNYYLDWNLDRK